MYEEDQNTPERDEPAPAFPVYDPGHEPKGYFDYLRRRGVIEVGSGACANCHSRVLPDGPISLVRREFPIWEPFLKRK